METTTADTTVFPLRLQAGNHTSQPDFRISLEAEHNRDRNASGTHGEKLTLEFFEKVVGSANVLVPALYASVLGEIELNDGMVLYGDTLYILQVKTRNPEAEWSPNGIEKWMRQRGKEAVHQSKKTQKFFEENPVIQIKKDNQKFDFDTTGLQLVSLVILVMSDLDNLHLIEDPRALRRSNMHLTHEGVLPLMRITLNELYAMWAASHDDSVMKYLRWLQDQPRCTVGDEYRRFMEEFSGDHSI